MWLLQISSVERRKVKDRCHLCEDVQRGDGASHHQNRIGCPEDLRGFSWEGFTFDEGLSTDNHLQFVLE